jgi:catechol 2,3-dioxygenase-like lactoylglutathione lyase family enzyme
MAFPLLKLLVLRTHRLEELKKFYESLGVEFVKERHGQGPSHYAGAIGSAVLELYPLPQGAPEPDKSVRLGFAVRNLGTIASELGSAGIRIGPSERHSPAVVIKDPDGRVVELTQEP